MASGAPAAGCRARRARYPKHSGVGVLGKRKSKILASRIRQILAEGSAGRAASPSRAIAFYAVLLILFLGLSDYWYAEAFFPPVQPTSAGTRGLIDRLAWYKSHTSDYNLVFVGDSRTYCDIHPELLDPLLHTSSLNLGLFAHWYLTQLPFVQDFAPMVPSGKTVVWSIGHQNFVPSTGVHRTYPVGFWNAGRYIVHGLPTTGLLDNLLYYNPALYFLTTRADLRSTYINFLNRPLDLGALSFVRQTRGEAASLAPSPNLTKPESALENQARVLQQKWEKDPRVEYVNLNKDENRITSLTVYFKRGSYYRIELDHEYFREKQGEFGSYSPNSVPQADPGYLYIFNEILKTFKRNDVHLVVNEVEEAPFVYGSIAERQVFRKFMHDVVESTVHRYGFPYVRVDFDEFTNSDYFDWDHLNSQGVAKFTPMLADQIRPYLNTTSSASAAASK